jgi:hypothetical protein
MPRTSRDITWSRHAAVLAAGIALYCTLPWPGKTACAQEPAASQSAGTAAPQKPAVDLNFNLLDTPSVSPRNSAANLAHNLLIERQVRRRRRLLTAHQVVGFVTLAAVAATAIVGQLNYQDMYTTDAAFTGRYQNAHLVLGLGSTALFAVTGGLALGAPNPYPKPYRLDSAMVHRVAMGLATAGMVTQVVLGFIMSTRIGYNDQANMAVGHLVVGWATFAFMATGTVAYVF